MTIFHRLIHWSQGSKSRGGRFQVDREKLLKTLGIIYFKIRDWFWAVGILGGSGALAGRRGRADSGAGGCSFCSDSGRSRVQFEWFRLSRGWRVRICGRPQLGLQAEDGQPVEKTGFDVEAASDGATTVREWLLRADQSIRANRLLTRAAQGGGGRIRVRGDCSDSGRSRVQFE